ncbi:MAG: hypothetical protein IJ406_03210 [Oscillospiraceae bacterium]|nr:hypothetical protein [Oscillospiraceae bacterium]
MPAKIDFLKAAAPVKKVVEITSFAGIDLSSAPADIDRKRSPDAPNMMPDSKGNPVKRPGFSFLEKLPGRINGSFSLGEKKIIHSGDSLFLEGEKIWEGMADELSSGRVVGDRLFIFDGFEALVFDGNDVHPICDVAYVPTVLISKNADECVRKTVLKGDGTSTEFVLEQIPAEIISVKKGETEAEYSLLEEKLVLKTAPAENEEITVEARYENEPGGMLKEEFNLLSRRWKESFLCETGTEQNFTLSQENLSEEAVRAWVMNENGEMEEKTEGEDFSVDRENGKIIFNFPVAKTPVSGEDNLVIEAAKYFEGYENKINFCRKSITYDSGGASTRIFVCGNPFEKQRDYWCAANDPTYWPDTYYSDITNETSEIIGYSIIEGYLATHIAPALDGRSVVLRKAEIDDLGNAVFPIFKHLQGEEAFAPDSFVYMEKEPLFITKRGVYAVTAEDISGEKYTQNRSFFINKALCAEPELKNAFCVKWKQFYVISVSGKLYLLDTSRRSYQRGEPLSSFQYECYLWENIPARILWEENGELFFGDSEGNIGKFIEGKFSDNGKAIDAFWTIPDFAGDTFWKNKTIRTVALELAPYPQNKVRLEVKIGGFWKILEEWMDKISYFSWGAINWENFTWNGNPTPRTVTLKTKIKKFDKVGFRIVCDEAEKAFGLYGFSVEYIEKGRFKK